MSRNNDVQYADCPCGSNLKFRFCCFKLEVEAKINLGKIERRIQAEVRKILVNHDVKFQGTEINARYTDCFEKSEIRYIPGKYDVLKVTLPEETPGKTHKDFLKNAIARKWEDYVCEVMIPVEVKDVER